MKNGEDIFLKVKDPKEKESIFQSLSQNHFEMICKSVAKSEEIIILEPLTYMKNTLTCRRLPEQKPVPEGNLIIQFMVGAEKYLMQTSHSTKDDQIYLDVSSDLFHLQRRNDFRLKLPVGYKAQLQIHEHNQKPLKDVNVTVLDLSGGGCRIEVDTNDLALNLNDTLSCEIKLNKRTPISALAQIKHASPNPLNPQIYWYGLQFVQLSAPSKNKIIAAVMDVYRELFTRT
ncbi:MAG: hypothetical protein BroJett040_05610 [Oligoflexia bacterium]|nr:MAG: hypothetical protein BroJett040_05610 [Oligoflexia bacterium]